MSLDRNAEITIGPATIGLSRLYTSAGVDPYDEVLWERRDARITNWLDGSVAFEQLGVEFPTSWSQNATNIVTQKYFRGVLGSPERECSLKQVVDRIVDTITDWGLVDGYFDGDEADAFSDELKYILVTQRAAFNSPVWFNIGVAGVPQQASACFILAVEDEMSSILNWYREEGIIFKGGSGAGVNLSRIRSSFEHLDGGGTASGPVSFMRGADASAGTIKSGGKTRRAAKMVILDADHPDIEQFVWAKAKEERKARALSAAGFDMGLDGADSFSVQYQNANNSVRVTDEFMQAVVDDADWDLRAVTTGDVLRTVRARDLWREIAEAAWECADPGLQFDTTINRWHTAPSHGRITASNPCSEYFHVDNSACNLASINLLKYLQDDGGFDVGAFTHTVDMLFTAQEILVGHADYPTEKIGDTTRALRQLGLGYANLGALLMALGLPYDSEQGRAWAAAITSLMTGSAYAVSARTAARVGPFDRFAEEADAMLGVLEMHRHAARNVDSHDVVPADLIDAGRTAWDTVVRDAAAHGVRNSQAVVIAPTGTIGLAMDCDTTGIEPDLALVKTKKLVGGGTMSIVNQTIPRALRRLGYSPAQVDDIVGYIDEHMSVVGAPHLAAAHLPVFACSMGDNTIHYEGHIRMMAAVQPFVSGGISKCVTGEALLPTNLGLVRIGSLHHDEEPDTFRDEILEVGSLGGAQKTAAFYFGGRREVREVELRSGLRITGTPNHRVLVVAESGLDWQRLDDLSVGDFVAQQVGAEMWSTTVPRLETSVSPLYGSQKPVRLPDEMTEELAFLLGAYTSEGCVIRSNWTVGITNSDAEVRERITEAWWSQFGVRARVDSHGGRCPTIEVSSKSIVEFLDLLGVGSRASEKRIPDAILRSPRAMVLGYLQGLALDAYTTAGRGAKWAICTDSPNLMDDVQAVLNNLGVLTSRISKYNRHYDKHFEEVYATGEHARRLIDLVPFAEVHKRDRAARTREAVVGRSPGTSDVVPGISPADLYRCLPLDPTDPAPNPLRAEFAFLRDPRTRHVTRRTLERVATVHGAILPQWLRVVLDDKLHFSPVANVNIIGHRDVFDVAVPASQSFVANGIVNHNTVNMPEDVTVEDVEALHLRAWELGLKSVAIYRDNCKLGQPLSTSKPVVAADSSGQVEIVERIVHQPVRQKMPRTRRGRTFEFRVADCKGFATIGEYDNGQPGEIFLTVSKQGSTMAGVMDAFAKSVSYGLQYGVPLRAFVEAFTNMRFEPAGMTDDPDIRFASSIMDYLFRRLAIEYMTYDDRAELGIFSVDERLQPTLPGLDEQVTPTHQGSDLAPDPKSVSEAVVAELPFAVAQPVRSSDAPMCMQCGIVMVRAGSCYVCTSCGSTSGCS